jgi:hypothetical protein
MLTNLFYVSLAYKAVVAPLMVGEANFYVQRLGLPEPAALSVGNTRVTVNPPLSGGLGAVRTDDFVYSFVGRDEGPYTNGCGSTEFREYGKLAYVMKFEPFQAYGAGIIEAYHKLARAPSKIGTNEAYHLAKEWLSAVEVDVAALERDYKPMSVQQTFYAGPALTPEQAEHLPTNAPMEKLPIFDVTWGGPDGCSPPVWIEILGPTKELVLLRMEDTRYSRRPPIVVTNALALCGLPQPRLPPGRQRATLGDILHVSKAYSNVVSKAMVAEASFFAEKLDLPIPRPLQGQDISVHVSCPTYFQELGYILAGGYEFLFPGPDEEPMTNTLGFVRFIEPGKLALVRKSKLLKEHESSPGELDPEWLKTPLQIDGRRAYQLATQWLAAVQVDVPALERKYKPAITQAQHRTLQGAQLKLPIFNVTWGGTAEDDVPVLVQILGTTKELLTLALGDTRFCRRPAIFVSNASDLNSRPDP